MKNSDAVSKAASSNRNNTGAAGRLRFLDGLRGIAILGVVLYHSYSHWPNLVPSAADYGNFPLFFYGGYGVELFFMISGFVILMTLEKCESFKSFMFKRWIRLFPAMLFCSILIYITAPLLPERPFGAVVLRDFLPGLTFLQQDVWEFILGPNQGIVEGSFWTLFVEMKFYVIFGACYFIIGAAGGIIVLTSLFLAHSLTTIIIFLTKDPSFLEAGNAQYLLNAFSAENFGWFAAGACFYLYFKSNNRNWAYYAMAATLLSTVFFKGTHLDLKVAALLFGTLFASAVMSSQVRRILASPMLVFAGFISYPLYLLHENLVVALSIRLNHWAPFIPSLILPVLPIGLVMGLAWLVAKYVEPQARTTLRALLSDANALLIRNLPALSYSIAEKPIGRPEASD
ncbi:MAG: acyltransferase [Rhodomicrobium sp.]